FSYPTWVGQIGLIVLNPNGNGGGGPSYQTEYRKYTVNGFYYTGYGFCSESYTKFHYLRFPFPLTVSTNYSVTTNYVYVDYSSAHPGTYGYNRYSSLMADGYGTLNLPSGITCTN